MKLETKSVFAIVLLSESIFYKFFHLPAVNVEKRFCNSYDNMIDLGILILGQEETKEAHLSRLTLKGRKVPKAIRLQKRYRSI